ncbi:MAG: hypothetical protein PVSMB7_27660 [Chloroflexota bacterium]
MDETESASVVERPGYRQRILSPAERRDRNRREMSEAILDIARDIMRQDGVAALSLSEIARRMQITTAALYRYFPSKFALYDALFRLALRVFLEYLEPVWTGTPPNWERLEAWTEAHMRFAHEQPDLFQLAFERPVPGFSPSEASMKESRQLLETGRTRFLSLVEAGAIDRRIDPSRAFDLFIAMRHGLSAQHAANEPGVALGASRYGSLVGDAMVFFKAAWEPRRSKRTPRDTKEEKSRNR